MRRSILRQLVVHGLLCLVLGQAVWAVAQGPRCGGRVRERGAWTTIDDPLFGIGPANARAIVLDPANPAGLYATNGAVIVRSLDGGCRWEETFSLAHELSATTGTTQPQVSIQELHVNGRFGGRVFATVESAVPEANRLPIQELHGGVLRSTDAGKTWSWAEGMPEGLSDLVEIASSPQDAQTMYLIATHSSVEVDGDLVQDLVDGEKPTARKTVFASSDGGASWEPRGDVPAAWEVTGLAVDSSDRATVFAEGDGLYRSTDGGRSWAEVEVPVGQVDEMALSDAPGKSLVVVRQGEYVFESRDRGRTWTSVGSSLGPTSIAVSTAGDLVITSATQPPESNSIVRACCVYVHDRSTDEWTLVSPQDLGVEEPKGYAGARRAGADGDLFYFRSDEGTEVFDPDFRRQVSKPPPEGEFWWHPPVSLGCPEDDEVAPWEPGWDPVPPGEGPVYAGNFDNGTVVRFDDKGSGTVVARGPKYAEGMSLDPLGNITTATRFSEIVNRMDPRTCQTTVLDNFMPNGEAPTFDTKGNLYLTNNGQNLVYKYPYPQVPGAIPKLLFRHEGFIEDLKIAPPGHPYEGDLLVLYMTPAAMAEMVATRPLPVACDAIARYTKTPDGWKRAFPDFANLRALGHAKFAAGGMDFLPNGHLLVPDWTGNSGEVLDIAPDGRTATPFSVIPPIGGEPPHLMKIATTGDGYSYITAAKASCMAGGARCGDSRPNGPDSPERQIETRIVRLDPQGNRLLPDFTHRLSLAVGVAVPFKYEPPPLPKTPLDPPIRRDPPEAEPPFVPPPFDVLSRALALAPAPPPPPPPPVVPGAGPANAASNSSVQAQAQSAANAQASQAQPMVVAQRQEQRQMALVHAAQQVQEQVGMEHAMSETVRGRHSDVEIAKYGLAILSLSMIVGFSVAPRVARRSQKAGAGRS